MEEGAAATREKTKHRHSELLLTSEDFSRVRDFRKEVQWTRHNTSQLQTLWAMGFRHDLNFVEQFV
jgi:hypothetical protein